MIWLATRRLDWAIRTHGPDLRAWPADERAAALGLMRRSRAARQMMADALANEDAPPADPPALCRMQRAVRRALAPSPPVLRGMRWGAMAACAAAGLYIGLAPLDQARTPDAPGDLQPTMAATLPATVLAAIDP